VKPKGNNPEGMKEVDLLRGIDDMNEVDLTHNLNKVLKVIRYTYQTNTNKLSIYFYLRITLPFALSLISIYRSVRLLRVVDLECVHVNQRKKKKCMSHTFGGTRYNVYRLTHASQTKIGYILDFSNYHETRRILETSLCSFLEHLQPKPTSRHCKI
jgi:hypothetical protein